MERVFDSCTHRVTQRAAQWRAVAPVRALDAACAAVTACSPTVPVETVCLPGCSERVLVEESKDASMVCIGAHG